MEKRYLRWISLGVLFLPMPFIWVGHGEAGMYGFSMLQNALFLWGGILLVLALFGEGMLGKAAGWFGAACLLGSYGGMTMSFQKHLPLDSAVWEICRLPMWISFVGAVCLSGSILLKGKEKM